MIELFDIHAGYRKREVLHGIRLTLKNGKLTALLGPNGSGKSTLLKAAAGLLPVMQGQVKVDGETALPRNELAKRLAYVPQSRNVPAITARRMVMHGRFPHLGYPRRYAEKDYAIADAALQRFDALPFAETPVQELSGGERQKVYLAMAFAQETRNILLDEPLTYLDIRAQMELMDSLRGLAQEGRAVAVALHDIGLALRCADDVAVLSRGRLIAYGTPDEICVCRALEDAFGIQVKRLNTDDGVAYLFQKK